MLQSADGCVPVAATAVSVVAATCVASSPRFAADAGSDSHNARSSSLDRTSRNSSMVSPVRIVGRQFSSARSGINRSAVAVRPIAPLMPTRNDVGSSRLA